MAKLRRAAYTLKEAAAMLGISYGHLRILCKNKLLTHVLLGNKVVIPAHVIEAIATGNSQKLDPTSSGGLEFVIPVTLHPERKSRG